MSRAETKTLTQLILGASLSRTVCTIAELGMADRWARRFTVTLFARQSPERESIFGPAMRKISPIREWRCVLAVLILVPAFQPCAHAQHALKFSPKVLEVLNTPPLEIKDDEDPLVRLKKERFNAALNEAKARFDLYKRGLTKGPHLVEVGERLFGAEVDLYDKPEDRARVLQRQLDVYNEAKGNLEKQVKRGSHRRLISNDCDTTRRRSKSTF
jgi:hypothetical protein